MLKQMKTILFSLIVIMSIIISGCLKNEPRKSEYLSEYIYEFSIYLTEDSNPTVILLPIPMLNGKVIGFDFSGKGLQSDIARMEIINSTYGPCLKIISNNSKKIVFNSTLNMINSDSQKSNLSMYESTLPNKVEYYCWIYYNGTASGNLTLKYHRKGANYGHIIGGKDIYDPPHELKLGWHKALVDKRTPIPD